jgi:hypothetical protein
MVQLSTTRCSWIAIFWDSLVSFFRHNSLCCFSTSFYYCCLFRYRLSTETFGYTVACFFFSLYFIQRCERVFLLFISHPPSFPHKYKRGKNYLNFHAEVLETCSVSSYQSKAVQVTHEHETLHESNAQWWHYIAVKERQAPKWKQLQAKILFHCYSAKYIYMDACERLQHCIHYQVSHGQFVT